MKTLHLHIGSYKTGTTSIQRTFHKNRSELKNQDFIYPGNELNHHKIFFATKKPEDEWPRQFRGVDRSILKQSVDQFFSILEKDLETNYHNYIISSEYLFIDDGEAIEQVLQYLDNFFSKVIVYVFVRSPMDYYASAQQQMIKARSYISSPDKYHYSFKNIIETWNNFFEVRVIEYNRTRNSCQILCEEIGIDYEQLSQTEQRSNTSVTTEQMVLLEKVQRNLYQDSEDTFKPHLGILQNIQAPFTNKPILKKPVQHLIYHNHKEDLEWLKENWSVDFLQPELETAASLLLPEFSGDQVSVREVYEVDEQSAERYEALIMDALLKNLVKQGDDG